MPDHGGDRGAVFLDLAPHDHPAYQANSDVQHADIDGPGRRRHRLALADVHGLGEVRVERAAADPASRLDTPSPQ